VTVVVADRAPEPVWRAAQTGGVVLALAPLPGGGPQADAVAVPLDDTQPIRLRPAATGTARIATRPVQADDTESVRPPDTVMRTARIAGTKPPHTDETRPIRLFPAITGATRVTDAQPTRANDAEPMPLLDEDIELLDDGALPHLADGTGSMPLLDEDMASLLADEAGAMPREVTPPPATRDAGPSGPTAEARELSAVLERRIAQLARTAGLSPREREVLHLLLLGRSYSEIGVALEISPRTARFHQRNVLEKIGAESRLDLFRLLL
jgi:DNA-binding CsgD family transcriptional regulator